MFAIYANNPVVYQLSALSLSVPWLRSSSKRQVHRNSSTYNGDTVSYAFKELVCQLDLNRVDKTALSLPFLFTRRKAPLGHHWKQSFVVSSFLDKCDHPGSSFLRYHNSPLFNTRHELTLSLSNQFAFVQQIRHFRSQRSITNESARSVSFQDRLKWVFPYFSSKKGSFMGSGSSVDLLKEPEKMRLKLAFAEGYEAGKGKKSKGSVIFKLINALLLIALIVLVGSSLLSGSGSVFKLQLGNHVEVTPVDSDVTFDDVKGADEAKQELKDIVEFLKYPDKFSALGAKLPKGALLVGPPGTGKTLLARAVAGEAEVPFFHAAGSEFDEVLVGQGARRVRDLFAAAKSKAPCVIFIDEIDAVGGKRTNSVLHPYANQTINQLLSEMDGFNQNEGVIVMGATNRREDLDKALLRPGRFDVEVHVNVPDFTGRKDIFELYLKKIKCKNIDIDVLARGTTGFTGADIENMVNLAALQAAVNNAKFVAMNDLENARDKVLMGPARKSKIPDDEANEITAYHESGHAIVAFFTKDASPIHKVTIIPRGPSLGHTSYMPKKERYHTRKSEMLATMDAMMGGRAAEELIFGPEKITSGAASDLKQATDIATVMVKEFGMSDKVGLRRIETNNGAFVSVNEISPNTTELIDQEIKKLLHDSYERAKSIIKTHAKEHKQLAEALLKYETLDADDVKAILNPNRKETINA